MMRIFNITEEQQLIRDSVSRFINEQFPFSIRQQIAETEDGFDRQQWQLFTQLGWLGMGTSEDNGGFGGSLVDIALICQEMAKGLLMSPYLTTVGTAGAAIRQYAGEDLKHELLEKLISGNCIISCALYEAENPDHQTQTIAVRTDAGLIINGCKRLVPYAAQADMVLVSARVDDSEKLVAVPTNASGIRMRPYKMYDGRRCADVEFSDVVVDSGRIFEHSDSMSIQYIVDVETAINCAEASAIMWQIHSQTLEYMRNREQFGQKLSEMQALQHRIVDVYVKCQLAQSMAESAVCAADDDAYDTSVQREISAAKAYISEQSRLVGKEGIQLHGGMGMTNDVQVGHYFKRLSSIAQSNGDRNWHLDRFIHLDSPLEIQNLQL